MPISIDEVYPSISSKVSIKFLLNGYYDKITFEDGDTWIDIHDPRITKLLKIPRTVSLLYNNSIPVTTHSYNVYGTTSLWWLIVMCSEYTHPHEIPMNTIILLPALSSLQSTFETTFTGLRNKIITI